MWKLKKIIETIIIFILVMLIICFSISLYQVLFNNLAITEIIPKTGLYFLYTIGYGALEGDAILQNILAMVGIVSLALMSTFLTINLFWRMDDVKLDDIVLYDTNNLTWNFINEGRTIYDMKISFTLYDYNKKQNIGSSTDYNIPILVKKSHFLLSVSLNDTFWYQALYQIVTDTNKKLYCIYSFVDTKNGQSSIKVSEITKEKIKDQTGTLNLEKLTKPVIIPIKNLLPIENGGMIKLDKEGTLANIKYEFQKKKDNFVMAYYSFHQEYLNLEKYNSNSYLEFTIKSKKNVIIFLEIKNESGIIKSLEIKVKPELQLVQLYLKEIPLSKDVKEICYTIFSKYNELRNEIEISDLKIIVC